MGLGHHSFGECGCVCGLRDTWKHWRSRTGSITLSRVPASISDHGGNGLRLLAKQVRYQLRHGPQNCRGRPERPARPTHDGTPTNHAEPISDPPPTNSASPAWTLHHLQMGRVRVIEARVIGAYERRTHAQREPMVPRTDDSAKAHMGSPSPPESTYAVAHVVPARGHRLRAAATLQPPGAAASWSYARSAGGV